MGTTVHAPDSADSTVVPPPLEAGDHLDQQAFHARYEAMPAGTQAELVAGVVYMHSPTKLPHSRFQPYVSSWLKDYEENTPGIEGGDHPTIILGEYSEPQLDSCLYILPEKGGQVRIRKDQYLAGAPELVVEIASSTESYDLHSKKSDYERAGVREYIAVALRQKKVFWFVLREGKFQQMAPHDDGIYRSTVFAGLWLDPNALLRLDGKRVREVLQQGCATTEYAEFAERLQT